MTEKKSLLLTSLALTTGALLVIVAVVLSARPAYRGTRAGFADENYLKSGDCRSCHADHYSSWARTYHSRMTQDATPASVQGDFIRDNSFEYLGVKAKMEQRPDGFFMTFSLPDGKVQVAKIDRTVGSRRIEQYLTKQENQYTRLPLAYDLVNHRWMSLNGSFFYPDGNSYFQHASQWDGNCVFCHNVKAQPHLDFKARRFNTEVAELGVACGACHGPSAAHAESALSPLTRTVWHLQRRADKQIVLPPKLPAERAMMICGHCHGQRIPEPTDRIQSILSQGDPFNAGDDLAQFYRPVDRDSHIGSVSFSSRFWRNGSPRLTAYEYQGVLRSKCFRDGEAGKRLNCLTCHTMHGGDPKGQITEENRGDKPCLSCHQKFVGEKALVAHTGHRVESTGSRCYNCHMPRVVYGIMTFHPTHDITVPDAQLTATSGVPNACNQCHLDRSVNWSIAESKRLWPARFGQAELSRDKQFDYPEGPRALFAGDALTRALAADLMSGNGPSKPDSRWSAPFLVEAFADNYPIVRFFAANGLSRSELSSGGPKLDYLASSEARYDMLQRWRALMVTSSSRSQREAETWPIILRALRRDVDLEVGE